MGDPDRLVTEIRAAYDGAAEGWAAGPASVYRRLAGALVGTAPGSLAGHRVLDLGAGTGVASEALIGVGAEPVAIDLAHAMLTHRQPHRPPGVTGDARALPFRNDAFDAVIAAFSLNHIPDPRTALGECRRVIRSGGLVLASTFPADTEHPAKAAVEAVLEDFGYRRPAWYAAFKARIADRTGDREAFVQAATAAGLAGTRVDPVDVHVGLDDPAVAVAWRLNMPHTIGFVADLDLQSRAALRARAIAALPPDLPPSVRMLALYAHVP